MDQIVLEGLLAVGEGLIVSVLTSITSEIGRITTRRPAGEDPDGRIPVQSASLRNTLRKGIESVSMCVGLGDPNLSMKLREFLSSPEAESIVRQMYASQLAPPPAQNRTQAIRDELLAALSLQMDEPESELKELAGALFDALVEGCEQALALSIDEGKLSAHEAKSASRYRVVLDALAGIEMNLVLLRAISPLEFREILEFERKYRSQVGDRHRSITPPHFDAARKLPIDEIYVAPQLTQPPANKQEELISLGYSQFLTRIRRTVLLGNPGGGKSTLTLKLCHDLAVGRPDSLGGHSQLTPVLVILRDYGAHKQKSKCSIVQFIAATANSTYQLCPPRGAFEYLLSNGRALVIFDGLDELLDTTYRQEITGDVESFCSLYPSVPVLVTSREVGYEQAPLDQKRFQTFHLAAFGHEQVKEYATKWFAADEDLTREQKKQMATAFLHESEIVPDLRSNPLMLALMCNIYRGESYIPRNRPDLYEKCSVMLFEKWDKKRGILVPLPFEAHVRPAMQYLAHWIYSEESLQGGVTESSLIRKATEYLSNWLFDDPVEAEKAAREFIDFCRGRAWVFTDTGTTRTGERLYQFTHRTFLEYFTAAHLVRTHPTPDKLGTLLEPRIERRECDVVAQLAFQIQHRNVEGAGDELLRAIIAQVRPSEINESRNLLAFAARCLEFLVPRPQVTREITMACTLFSLDSVAAESEKGDPKSWAPQGFYGHHDITAPDSILRELLHASPENRAAIAGSLEKQLIERINSCDEAQTRIALEVSGNLYWLLQRDGVGEPPRKDDLDFWTSVSDRIDQACSARIRSLLPKAFAVCLSQYWRGRVGLADLVGWHGIESLFRYGRYNFFPTTWMSPAAVALIYRLFSSQQEAGGTSSIVADELKLAGRALLQCPPPWIKARGEGPSLYTWMFRKGEWLAGEPTASNLVLDSDAMFGVFVLYAPLLEVTAGNAEDHGREVLEAIKSGSVRLFDSMRLTFLARFDPQLADKVQLELDKCGFSVNQQEFIWKWVERKVNLAEPRPQHDEVGFETSEQSDDV